MPGIVIGILLPFLLPPSFPPSLPLFLSLPLSLFFSFLPPYTHDIGKFLGQGSNPSPSSDNAKSLTTRSPRSSNGPGLGSNPSLHSNLSHYSQIFNPLHHSGNFSRHFSNPDSYKMRYRWRYLHFTDKEMRSREVKCFDQSL